MRSSVTFALTAAITFAVAFAALASFPFSSRDARADAGDDGPQPEAVEDDDRDLMNHYFNPPYLRVKAAIVQPPADRAAWDAIRSDALILAEGANLLLWRAPDDAPWKESSVQLRQSGGALYRAARARNFDAAKTSYAALVQSCNHCHRAWGVVDVEP